MRAAPKPLAGSIRALPKWWWVLLAVLVLLDVAIAMTDAAASRRYQSDLQGWMLLQALLAIAGMVFLAARLRDLGYAIIAALFTFLVLEDWLQVFTPARLWLRDAIHELIPGLGSAPERLATPDPVDLVAVLVGAGAVILALRASRPALRIHTLWLSGFIAMGFLFGVLLDLYNDYNYSRLGVLVEETGEAIAISGALAYLVGVTWSGLGEPSVGSDTPAGPNPTRS